jgi:hypothetical protein
MAVYKDVVEATCPVGDDAKEDATATAAMDALEARVALALAVFAQAVPATERAPIIHIFLHVPATIRRWNSVRNFWCYAIERCTPVYFCMCTFVSLSAHF